jgi:hypothetical protein
MYGAYADGEFRKNCVPKGQPGAFFFFISYTTFSSFIVLSIFLGVIQIAMDEASEGMNEYKGIIKDLKRLRIANPERNSYILLLLEAFRCLDTNGSQWISLQELLEAVCAQPNMDNSLVIDYFTKMDKDGDRKIDPVEFVKFVSALTFSDDDEKKAKSKFAVGDRVKVNKISTHNGDKATVTDPDWTGRVKVEMDRAGDIKSYKPAELDLLLGEEAASPTSPAQNSFSPKTPSKVSFSPPPIEAGSPSVSSLRNKYELPSSAQASSVSPTDADGAVPASAAQIKSSAKKDKVKAVSPTSLAFSEAASPEARDPNKTRSGRPIPSI